LPERFLGRTLGKYHVEALLGTGGFAWVFRALDPDLGVRVALKVLKPQFAGDAEFEERFRREASVAARLRHPNIVTIYAVGRDDDAVYFAMDCLPDSLAGRLGTATALPGPAAVRIALDVAAALGYAHREGIVHRDVKPDNVLFDEHGNAIVADFGIARAVDPNGSDTTTRFVVGTPHYFAPEQARGRPLDGRADLYALGVTLYRAVAGVLPFPGDDWFEVAKQHVDVEPADVRSHNPAVSPELARVIHRLLEKSPDERYATAEDAAAALQATPEHGEPVVGRTVAVPALDRIWTATGMTARRRRLRRRVLIAAGSVCGVAVAAAVAMQMRAADADASGTPADTAAVPPADSAPPLVLAPPTPPASPDSIAADTATRPAAPPRPTTGTLTIEAPDDARVYLGDRLLGTGRRVERNLRAAEYRIRAVIPDAPEGCESAVQARVASVVAGASETISLSPVGCGTLVIAPTVNGEPLAAGRGAVYSVTGRVIRRGPIESPTSVVLPAGEYQLEISTPGCYPFSGSVRVDAGGRAAPRIIVDCGRG